MLFPLRVKLSTCTDRHIILCSIFCHMKLHFLWKVHAKETILLAMSLSMQWKMWILNFKEHQTHLLTLEECNSIACDDFLLEYFTDCCIRVSQFSIMHSQSLWRSCTHHHYGKSAIVINACILRCVFVMFTGKSATEYWPEFC